MEPWALERFFPGWEATVYCSRKCPKDFFKGDNSGEISFYQLETKMKLFFY